MEEDARQAPLVSKSQRKRDLLALQSLASKLLQFNQGQLRRLPLAEPVRQALDDATKIRSKPALRRQVRLLAQLLDQSDHQAVCAAVNEINRPQQQQVAHFHEIEQWRDRLIQDGDEAITAFMDKRAVVDGQHLRQLVRNAQKELAQGKPPLTSKKLFQWLKNTLDKDAAQ